MIPAHFKHICKIKGWKLNRAGEITRLDFKRGTLKKFYTIAEHDSFGCWLTQMEAEKIGYFKKEPTT